MTIDQIIEPLQRLSSNYGFMNVSDRVTVEMWFNAFQNFDIIDFNYAVNQYICSSTKTPTVADIMEVAQSVRSRKQESRRRTQAETKCQKCSGFGFVTIIYPSGCEAVIRCGCKFDDKPAEHVMDDFEALELYGLKADDLRLFRIMEQTMTAASGAKLVYRSVVDHKGNVIAPRFRTLAERNAAPKKKTELSPELEELLNEG